MQHLLKRINYKKNKIWLFFYIIITFILISVFLLEFKLVGQSVYGDARYYMSYTRSLYFSRNADITDEMSHYWSPETNNLPVNSKSVPELDKYIKVTSSNFSLGVSFIWLPIYFTADILVIIFSKFDSGIIRNGYSDIYQIVLGIGNIFFVISGLFFLSKILSNYYKRFTVQVSLITILFTTNLFYYSSIDVVNSHPFSFFGSSLIIYLLFKYVEEIKIKFIFIQGLIFGLIIANRMQDVLLLLIPLVTIFYNFNLKKIKIKKEIVRILTLLLGIFIGYLPQLFLLYLGQHKFLLAPHVGKAENDFLLLSHFKEVLFDPKQGFFYYMPILFLAIIGLLLFKKRDRKLGSIFIITFAFIFLLISSYDGWNVAGYTTRYFISALPILVFGLAELLDLFKKRFSKIFIALLVFVFIIHQGISIFSFKLFYQDPTYVGSELSTSGKLKIKIIEKISDYSYPFRYVVE